MPTSPRKARLLLKQGKAKVIKVKPFIIQLLYTTGETKQDITIGVDSGYENIGISAVTDKAELFSAEVTLLEGISERLKERAMYRNNRRNRLRHRKPRFNNRKRHEGWLAPSIQHKFDSHIRLIDYIKSILPVTKTIIEVANFDIQKIKNPDIESKSYQEGEQSGYWNLREYIFHRDNHKCQNPDCKNKSKEIALEVHHIGYYKKDRSNRPDNLITLCTKCHSGKNHKEGGLLWGFKPELEGFKPETFMSTVRWRLVDVLSSDYTYGYITKTRRINIGLEKSHANDAFVIAGGQSQYRCHTFRFNQVRRNNRSLERFYDAKYMDIRTGEIVSGQKLSSGRRTRNKNLSDENQKKYRGHKVSKGRRSIRKQRYFYQPNDLVKYEGKVYSVKGTQNRGKYVALKGVKKVHKVELLEPYRFRKGFIC